MGGEASPVRQNLPDTATRMVVQLEWITIYQRPDVQKRPRHYSMGWVLGL